jgi:thiol-disulfide isomerase/thioredoxin
MKALSLSLALCALLAAPSQAASGDGLKPGTLAPVFVLPVLGPFKEQEARFGPAKWTGKVDAPKRLVLLSFFATYCEPCKKEMPELARLFDAYEAQGLGVMLVSIDKGDEQRDTVVALAEEYGVRFPVLHDRYQVVARRYEAERLPYMLLLDLDGVVKTVHIGYTEELKADLENEVRAGLGLPPLVAVVEPPPPPATGNKAVEKKAVANQPPAKTPEAP